MLDLTTVKVASAFLAQEIGPLETARLLSHLHGEGHSQTLHDALETLMAVASECDDIPLGWAATQWHVDVRADRDAKAAAAADWARPMVAKACEDILRFARWPNPAAGMRTGG